MEQIIIDNTTVNSDLINHMGQKYPQIIFQDSSIVKPSIASGHLNNVFIEDDKSFLKQTFQHYRSKGFFSMLEFVQTYHNENILKNNESNNNVHLNGNNQQQYTPKIDRDSASNLGVKIFYYFALMLLYIRFLYLTIHYYFYPFDKYSSDALLQEFNPNLNWKSGLIRAFDWHPSSLRCALALVNDMIYVYSADTQRPLNHICCLKNLQQRRVVAIVWHPKRDDILAVACDNRILVWFLQSDLKNFKPDLPKCLLVINCRLSNPITSVVFDAEGNTLVACSPRNSSLSVIRFNWDQRTYTVELVRKPFCSQFTSLCWSPDKTRLLAHCTGSKICIFESRQWSHKCWQSNLADTVCQTSVWSRPTGRILLYVPKHSSRVFALTFYDKAEPGDVGGQSDDSILLLDTSEQHFGANVQLGSVIQQIVWDCKSTRLAISFQDNSELIALYSTTLSPSLQITPLCTIRCDFATSAQCLLLRFHDHYIDSGSLLTVCWSNGTVSHIPLTANTAGNDSNDEMDRLGTSIRSLTSLCTSFTSKPHLDDSQQLMTPSSPQASSQSSNGVNKSLFSPRITSFHNSSPFSSTTVGAKANTTTSNNATNNTDSFLRSPTVVHSPRRVALFSTRVKLD